jgi:ABC-type uncharacterized transport system permease subunit
MAVLRAAGGGFLLAVLWMDLMFDVQAWRLGDPPGDAARLQSIVAYYRRVTTDAFPMNRLIAAVMLATVALTALGALRARVRRGRHLAALLFAAAPIGLALARVFPNAVRLGAGADPPAVQAALARGILQDHVACFAAIAAFVALQLRLRA